MSRSPLYKPSRRDLLVASLFVSGVSLALPAFARGLIAKDSATGAAIKGYDTTAYFIKGAAAKGTEIHSVSWKGATWRFLTQDEADLFAANPESYAPQFGGYCTRAMSFKKLVPADPEVWRIHAKKLYMFARPLAERNLTKPQSR